MFFSEVVGKASPKVCGIEEAAGLGLLGTCGWLAGCEAVHKDGYLQLGNTDELGADQC